MTRAFSSAALALAAIPLIEATDADRPPLASFVDTTTLVEMLNGIRGARVLTLETRTQPRLLAKHPLTGEANPFRDNLQKMSRVNGMIGWVYSNSVNNQRTREGVTADFEPFKRAWGTRLPNSPFVEHRGALYLELKVERSLGRHYETLDGQPVDAELIEPYLPQRRPGRQGIKREVLLRDYSLASIQMLKIYGITYILRHPESAETPISVAAAA